MTAEREFKYDVAFSFLARDLGLARDLTDGLAPLRVFLFIREQEEIAGTNGMETFSRVFKEEARLNVVLLREGWGETQWTRVEATAIQERALQDGWPTIFVVKLDKARAPVWIPRQHLYLDFEEFGREQAVGAIRARALAIGAPSRKESPEEVGARLARREVQRQDNWRRFSSDEGVKLANTEALSLFERISAAVERMQAAEPTVAAECAHADGMLVVRRGGRSMSLSWELHYTNSLDGARLYRLHYYGPLSLPGKPQSGYALTPQPVDEQRILPEFAESGALYWRANDLPHAVSIAVLADHLLTSFLEFAYAPKKENAGANSFGRRVR